MRDILRPALGSATSLHDVGEIVIPKLKEQRFERLGFVAGLITSHGREHTQRNLERLGRWRAILALKFKMPVFSANCIFDESFLRQIGSPSSDEEWFAFWRHVHHEVNVTDLFMTPGWSSSRGARDEHAAARKRGINIHLIDPTESRVLVRERRGEIQWIHSVEIAQAA